MSKTATDTTETGGQVHPMVRHCCQCNQPLIEIRRNEYGVFYKCACNRNKGADWDHRTALIGGVEYELGTAGSLILCCPKCGEEHFREASNYFDHPDWHKCFSCKTQMEPIRTDELETRWKPFWEQLDA